MRYTIFVLLISALVLLAGCDVSIASENTPPTPVFVTATLPSTAIPQPSQTPLPSTPISTVAPVEGMTTTQVNVRAETSTASGNLGTIGQFSKVQIIGRDSSTSWYQIIYAGTPNGSGWIRAEYVQVNAAVEIPVIESRTGSGAAVSGLVIQKINVRSGPATTFESLGELNPNDVVFISGKDPGGAWLQIEYSNSADGKGWVALEFLQVENIDALPVIGIVSPTAEAVVNTVATQTNVSLSVLPDGDSIEAPLARITFSPLGTRTAQVNGGISAANGDTEDWIEFTSYNGRISIQLFCSNGGLQVELQSNGESTDNFLLICEEKRLLKIIADQSYLLRLSMADTSGTNQTSYMLVLENIR